MQTKRMVGVLLAGGLLTLGGFAAADDHDKKETRAVEKNEVTAKNDDSKYQQLEERIEAKYSRDKGLKEHRIDVDIHDGKVVLKGEVDSQAERTRAGRIAKQAGAKMLDNQLTVEGARERSGGFFGTPKNDDPVDRAEDRADKAKDQLENKAEAAKDRVDENAKAEKKRIDQNLESEKKNLDRNVEDVKNEVQKGDGDRPFDGK